jgi:CBS domain-containing protein
MTTLKQPFLALTAGDLMSQPVKIIPQGMSLRAAARVLFDANISGAPVVDASGRCVGVLSTTDFVRWAAKQNHKGPEEDRLPLSCSFQIKAKGPTGQEVILCTLASGACPMQVPRPGPGGKEVLVCNQPHAVFADWQSVELEELPADEVHRYMTADPVLVLPSTPIGELARRMVDAHIHRLIVVDLEGRPVGVVSSTDVLASVARLATPLPMEAPL